MADGIISKIQLPDNTIYDVVDNTSGYMTGMTILSYGSSTWQNFIDAYSSNKVVYCRASSNANPATGSQTRLAFMAYVNNATTPTEVEFQYYRSVSSHTASQQGDQVFVYKLSKTNGWSVTVREASVKVVAGTGLGGTYSNGTMTLTGPTKVSDLTNDSGFLTSSSTLDASKLSGAIPSAITATTQTSTDNSTKIATTAYVTTAIANLPEPMIFKGSVGTNGTITSLPAAAAANEGFTYKVITALSTPVTAKVGDTVISNGSAWIVIPSGDEPSGTVTSVGLTNATDGGLTISDSPITSSGSITVGHANVLSSAQTTQAVYPIKIDKNGHISGYGTAINLEDTKVFLVTITQNGDDYVSDKTAEEIINAYNAGRVVIVSDYYELYYLSYIDETHDTNLDSYTAMFHYYSVDFSSEPMYLYRTNVTISTVNDVTTVYYNSHSASIAYSNHTHGNITNTGDITTTATIANGDRLVINDESASKVNNSSITFGTSTSQYLANNGTWQSPHTTQTITLSTTWSSNQQTVTVSGVTSSNYVVVSPAPASYDDYCEAGIYCSAQGTNSLTFKCDTAPSSSLTVNVMIIG